MSIAASPPIAAPPADGEIPASGAEPLGIDDLRQLMRSVDETTRQLQSTHVALQKEVVRLQRELAEANAQLRRSKALAALGEMAAGIAHEIRNPLGSIRLYVQMLAEDLAEAPAQADLCEKISRAVTGLDHIVRDVLLFSREMKVRAAATTARDLVEQALSQCEVLFASSDIQRKLEVPDDPACTLHADTCLITQALGNVVRNAVEAMGEADGPRRVTISAARRRVRTPEGRQAQRVVIAVEDTGPGIPPDVVQRMFNPFFTTRRTGTGLGLAIVHRIIDAHGGHINVRNGAAGGARIELCLPAKPTASNRTPPANGAPEIEVLSPPGAVPSNGPADSSDPADAEVSIPEEGGP